MPRRKPIQRKTPLRNKTPLKRRLENALQGKTELKRTEWKPERKPINKVSAKKKDADKEYEKNRKAVLEAADYICEAKIPGYCTRVATETNHIMKRSSGKPDHSVANLMAICHSCHARLEESPEFARQRGWLVTGHRQFGVYMTEARDD